MSRFSRSFVRSMSGRKSDWTDDPEPDPPFVVLDYGASATIVDREGRVFDLVEHRQKAFVNELASILNENAARLVDAWRLDRRARGGRSRDVLRCYDEKEEKEVAQGTA